MRDPIQYYENKIEELSKMKRKDYKSTIFQSPEDEVIFLLKEIEKVTRMIKQGLKF